MEPKIKEDILKILNETLDILEVREEKDILELSEVSDHVIHNASIYQDEDSISIAVLIYSVYKVIERPVYLAESYYTKITELLKAAKDYLDKDNVQNYRKAILRLFRLIGAIDRKLKMYIEEVVTKARIKKGSKLFEHGLSLGKAADLMGISQWELMEYIGRTHVFEKEMFVDDVKARLRFTRKLFK
ncbi:UPF0175 family protein [Candidatus Woesearchaeota archaeon]|nr:UPF0175 family protein [Candidatus Woesearchaeota archaeon]